MKYYSRSPEELKERFEEAKRKEKSRYRTIRLFFILNILLVVLVFGILQYRLRYEEEKNKPKNREFILGQYLVRSFCQPTNCQIEIQPTDQKPLFIDKPSFLVFSQISFREEKKTIVALSPEIFGVYFYNPKEPLQQDEKIKLYILSKNQKELFSFEIYP